jgi:hypothetical protein
MKVTYGSGPPPETNTEITTYMWPRFLGEYNHGDMSFRAWYLVDSGTWIPRPDITAPPLVCYSERARVRRDGGLTVFETGVWRLSSVCEEAQM